MCYRSYFYNKKIKVSLRNLLLKNLQTTQEVQTQSTNSLRKKTNKNIFFEVFEKDQSGMKWKHA